MNERIQQLAEQARKYARDYVADCKHYGHYMEHNELEVKFEEKFAELIVRQCASISYRESCYSDPENVMGFDIAKKIEEHFGVEE
jgi:hypothetical protein